MNVNNNEIIKPITIIGCGPGGKEYLIPIAYKCIKESDVLIGSRRLLSLYSDNSKINIEITAEISSILIELETLINNKRSATVLVTGDTGIASISTPIVKKFGINSCRCIPGISSVQLACARLCLDWTNAEIINAHKGLPIVDDNAIRSRETVIILCGNRTTWPWIEFIAKNLDQTHNCYRCADLGLESEMISTLRYIDFESLPEGGGNAVLIWQRKDSEK